MRNPSHLAWISLAAASFTTPLTAQDPNVIVIISDDAGFADFGFQSAFTGTDDEVPTPNLDALAGRGVLCTNAYTAAVCSPSRAAITTGSYQNRIGYEYNINNRTNTNQGWDGLRPEVVTIFERMKTAGYTTGAIGKWHLGAIPDVVSGTTIIEPGNRPPRQGVDEFFGILKGSRNYTVGGVTGVGTLREMSLDGDGLEVDTILETTAPWNTTSDYVTEAFGQGSIEFVDRHHADTEPFFLYVAFTAPHGPIGDSPDIGDPRIATLSGKRKQYASMVLTMDAEIGRLMDKLADPAGDGTGAGLDADSIIDDTLVIFINDNGGASGNGTVNTPLQGWKGSTWEGGTRVPMILAGPGITATGGSNFDKPVHSIDILPTCMGAAGEASPAGIDGVNLLPYLNGTFTTEPHSHVIIRAESKIGLRFGDWKLHRAGSGSDFELYDLANDIHEDTDVAASNSAIYDQLIRDVTEFESGFDKPRHAGLNNNAESINFNDRFILDPPPPGGTFTPLATLVGGATLNGDFNAGGAGGVQTFALTPDWTNIGSGTQDDNATNTNQDFDGSRNGIVAETATREFGLDTGYTLVTGDAFRAGYVWKDASGWADGNDKIRVTLFTTSDNTITGTRTDIRGINSALSAAAGAYQAESHTFSAVDTSVNGKRLFLSINAAQTGGGFARIDNVVLERGTIDTGGATADVNWTAADTWTDYDTGLADTLLDLDSFPGCVLEFPTTNTFSYTATNNMTRPTGLEFMLNRLILSGTFAGATPQSGTIDGNELMFTNDLSGASPVISLSAIGSNFTFTVNNRLVLYDELVISGNGNAPVRLTGGVRDYFDPCKLTKTGSSDLTVSGLLAHAGITTIAGGSFILDQALLSESPTVNVYAGATLGGNGTITGQITGAGTVAPGLSPGTLAAGSATLTGNLEIELDGNSSDRFDVAGALDISATTLDLSVPGGGATRPLYLVATYGSLTGTFATVNGMPAGYTIDYAYGPSSDQLAIRTMTAYETWTRDSGLSPADSALDADPNGDGVPNGVAFITGAPDASASAIPLLPTATRDGSDLLFTFRRVADTAGLTAEVDYGSNLASWDTAAHGTASVIITETPDGFAPGIDKIDVRLPATLASGEKLFARLVVR